MAEKESVKETVGRDSERGVTLGVKKVINNLSLPPCNVKIILSLLAHHFPCIPVS